MQHVKRPDAGYSLPHWLILEVFLTSFSNRIGKISCSFSATVTDFTFNIAVWTDPPATEHNKSSIRSAPYLLLFQHSLTSKLDSLRIASFVTAVDGRRTNLPDPPLGFESNFPGGVFEFYVSEVEYRRYSGVGQRRSSHPYSGITVVVHANHRV